MWPWWGPGGERWSFVFRKWEMGTWKKDWQLEEAVLHCITLHCIALQCAALHLFWNKNPEHCLDSASDLHCILLHCNACIVLALSCSAFVWIAMLALCLQCIMLALYLYCIAVNYAVLQCTQFYATVFHCAVWYCLVMLLLHWWIYQSNEKHLYPVETPPCSWIGNGKWQKTCIHGFCTNTYCTLNKNISRIKTSAFWERYYHVETQPGSWIGNGTWQKACIAIAQIHFLIWTKIYL